MQIVYIILAAVICIGAVIYSFSRMKKLKVDSADFLAQYPDAAKIYLAGRTLFRSEAVQVTSVDGELPHYFQEGGKMGFYALPGNRTVEMNYTNSRPGITHKNAAKSTGIVKKELTIDADQTYLLGFNRKTGGFTFDPNFKGVKKILN